MAGRTGVLWWNMGVNTGLFFGVFFVPVIGGRTHLFRKIFDRNFDPILNAGFIPIR